MSEREQAKAKRVQALHSGYTRSPSGKWSMDWVQPRYECSVCRTAWEPFTEDGVTYCANCGAKVEDEE